MTLFDVPTLPQAIPQIPPSSDVERRMCVHGVSWETYSRLCDEIVHAGTRITFDQGRMEIVVVSQRHEDIKTSLARIIEAYGDAVEIDAYGLGNMTLQRRDLDRGLEPDECYYVANAALIRRSNREVDLAIDPPPDLAIEVDISPPDVAKPPIYGAMGVPEIWRFDGRAVTYLVRGADGDYAVADRSPAFPDLPIEWVNEALAIGLTDTQMAAANEIRRRVAAVRRQQ